MNTNDSIVFLLVMTLVAGGSLFTTAVSSAPTPDTPKRPDAELFSIRSTARNLKPLTSLLIDHRGRRVMEYYAEGVSAREPANIKSASKSVLSALVGIALSQEHLQSLDQTVGDFFPQLLAGASPAKHSITLRDLLLMRSGLESTSFEAYGAWVTTDHWLKNALDQPLVHEPGTVTRYSTGNSHIVAAILTEAVGRDLRDYAQDHLFGPLGVRIHAWQRSPEGYRFGGNNLSLTPQGLLRFGRLYLKNGRWQGSPVIPADWVHRSTRALVHDTYHGYPYGYYWWKARYHGCEVTFAWGHGGQYVFIVPARELVVVTTSNLQSEAITDGYTERIHQLLKRRILPAVHSRRTGPCRPSD